jgi:nucleotide-binding universal stress UspA family protein
MVSPAHPILYRHQQTDSIMKNSVEKTAPMERQTKSNPGIKRIVVATDLSDHSRKTTEYALALAKHFCASLTLVHVFEPDEITFTAPQVGENYEAARHYAEQALLNLFEETRQTYPDCGMEFRVGEPVKQIASMAHTLNADLVVIGGYHLSALARLFATDGADRMIRAVGCPVLVWR